VLQTGGWCSTGKTLVWGGGQTEMKLAILAPAFRDQMTRAGYKVAGAGGDLFDAATPASADYAIAGRVTREDIRTCTPSTREGPRGPSGKTFQNSITRRGVGTIGISLFTPARDAADFLALDIR
jgi:hypothetical protein